MKTLIFLRHGESGFPSRGFSDFERTLNQNGIDEVGQIAFQLQAGNLIADAILCSSATRAMQTYDELLRLIPECVQATYYKELYLAPLNTLLDIIDEWFSRTASLMIIGHNPGLESVVKYLCGTDLPYAPNGSLLSTANCAIISVNGEIKGGAGTISAILRPRVEYRE